MILRISLSIILSALAISFALFAFAFAQSDHDPFTSIVYPVEELGNCEDRSACEAYCNDFDHINECLAFAEERGLLVGEDLEHAKRFAAAGTEGPGGCISQETCEAYCEDIANIDECLAFGEQHGLIPPEELEEARKVARALQEGAVLPGGCTSKDACELYCSDEAHIEECLAFGEAAGLIPPEELEMARKFVGLLKSGDTPGGCVGERECRTYCENPDHFEECIAFAEKMGAIPPEELELIKKTGGKGPGDCRGREECEAYCNDPANQEVCFAFAKEHGLISDEDLEHAREGFGRLREELAHTPPEVRVCLEESLGVDILAKIESGEPFTPSLDLGTKIKGCFEAAFGAGFGGDGREGHGGDFGGQSSFDVFSDVPPQVLGCLSSELGFERYAELRDQDVDLGPEDVSALRHCFESSGVEQPHGLDSFEGGGEGGFVPPSGGGFPDFDPHVLTCLEGKLGSDFKQRLYSGELDRTVIEETIRVCLEESTAAHIRDSKEEEVHHPAPSSDSGVQQLLVSPDIEQCLVHKLGSDYKERLYSGQIDPSVIEQIIRECTIEQQTEEHIDESSDEEVQSKRGVRSMLANAWRSFIDFFQ